MIPTTKEIVDKVLDEFDFRNAYAVIEALNLKVPIKDVPKVPSLARTVEYARKALTEAYKGRTEVYSNGFLATYIPATQDRSGFDGLRLQFVVDDVKVYADEFDNCGVL